MCQTRTHQINADLKSYSVALFHLDFSSQCNVQKHINKKGKREVSSCCRLLSSTFLSILPIYFFLRFSSCHLITWLKWDISCPWVCAGCKNKDIPVLFYQSSWNRGCGLTVHTQKHTAFFCSRCRLTLSLWRTLFFSTHTLALQWTAAGQVSGVDFGTWAGSGCREYGGRVEIADVLAVQRSRAEEGKRRDSNENGPELCFLFPFYLEIFWWLHGTAANVLWT